MSHKQSLHLRLLCEEMDGMLPNITSDFSGDFWIEFEDGLCKVNASIELKDLTAENKEELIDIAKNRKNSAAVGISGKIRAWIEDYLLVTETANNYFLSRGMFSSSMGGIDVIDYSYLWSLNQYKSEVSEVEQAEEWDELEKSVIASVADDVIVGIKGKRADIVIVKKFA